MSREDEENKITFSADSDQNITHLSEIKIDDSSVSQLPEIVPIDSEENSEGTDLKEILLQPAAVVNSSNSD